MGRLTPDTTYENKSLAAFSLYLITSNSFLISLFGIKTLTKQFSLKEEKLL